MGEESDRIVDRYLNWVYWRPRRNKAKRQPKPKPKTIPYDDYVVVGKSLVRKDKTMSLGNQTHTVVVSFQQLSTGSSAMTVRERQMRDTYTAKKYHYLTHRNDIEVGGWAVVWSPIFNAPALVRIDEILWNTKSQMAFKHLIDVVDLTEYQREQLRLEAEAAEKRRRAQRVNELEHEINRAKQRVEAQLVQERLQQDPDIASAMAELAALKNMD